MLIRMDPDCDAWWQQYYGGSESEIRDLCVIEEHVDAVDAILADVDALLAEELEADVEERA